MRLFMVILASAALCQDCDRECCKKESKKKHCTIDFTLKDVAANCCVEAVKAEFVKIDGVKVATIIDGKVSLKISKTKRVALSDLQKALDNANKAMGKAMGKKYSLVSEEISVSVLEFVYRQKDADSSKATEEITDTVSRLTSATVSDVRLRQGKDEFAVFLVLEKGNFTLAQAVKAFESLKNKYTDVYFVPDCCQKCAESDEVGDEQPNEEEKKGGC